MAKFIIIACAVAFTLGVVGADRSASDVASEMYDSCLGELSVGCVKPKALAWMSEVAGQDKIRITDDLAIIRTGNDDMSEAGRGAENVFDQIEGFLTTHALKVDVPQILKLKETRSLIPESFLDGGLANGLVIPLSENSAAEGRGFVKKVVIPFMLGLKFKAGVMLPLGLALIALKTWKAMTLGLLSLVLSAALVIFKITKPKIVNYEVIHYPHPHHHHVDHIVDHHVEHPHHHHGWEPAPGWARSSDGQEMAYAGQEQQQQQ